MGRLADSGDERVIRSVSEDNLPVNPQRILRLDWKSRHRRLQTASRSHSSPTMIEFCKIDSSSNAIHLSTELWVPQPVEQTFEFFADASNLEAITPPWLRFRIVTSQPVEMAQGTLIDYSLRLHGIPIRWRTEISVWSPPFSFIDRQLHGPYHLWEHTHTFEARDGGTVVRDDVDYLARGGRLVERLFVRPDLRRIFEYRNRRFGRLCGRKT